MKVDMEPTIGRLIENIEGKASASAGSLSRQYGIPIYRVRQVFTAMGVRDSDHG